MKTPKDHSGKTLMTRLEDLPRKNALCTKCGKARRPMVGYLKLLKSRGLPYVCQECRESESAPAMNLGKLGKL